MAKSWFPRWAKSFHVLPSHDSSTTTRRLHDAKNAQDALMMIQTELYLMTSNPLPKTIILTQNSSNDWTGRPLVSSTTQMLIKLGYRESQVSWHEPDDDGSRPFLQVVVPKPTDTK